MSKIKYVEPVDLEKISATDLREEAEGCSTEEYSCYLVDVDESPEKVQLLWLHGVMRAGITWGADATWTDADSPIDALERYFGINDKTVAE